MRWFGLASALPLLFADAGALSGQGAGSLEQPAATEFELREVVRVGGWDERPGHALEQVTAGLVRADGSFVVADQGARQVRFYTPSGDLIAAVGRDGDGPGEFRSLQGMGLLPDGSIVVWDFASARLTILGPEGQLGRTRQIHDPELTSLHATFVGVFPDTSVVMRDDVHAYALRQEPVGLRRDTIRLRVYGPDGTARSPVVKFLGPERLLYRVDGSWGTVELLFARDVTTAVTVSELLIASGDSLAVRWYDPSGRLRRALAVPYEPVQATRGDVAAERARRRVAARRRAEARKASSIPFATSTEDQLREELERIDDLDAYASLPVFRHMVVADGQTVWVEDAAWGESAMSHWHQLDSNLRAVGLFELPVAQRLLGISAERVLVLELDEFDVASVVVYRLDERRADDTALGR